MRTHFLAAFFFIMLTAGCKKDNADQNTTLNRKWQLHSFKVLKMDDSFNQGACNYQTKASDFYDPPSLQHCRADDIYDFTSPQTMLIFSGSRKCMPDEANVITKTYEQKGDSLFMDGNRYRIVLLSSDTLILDYCTEAEIYAPMPVVNRAKLGMKFVGAK